MTKILYFVYQQGNAMHDQCYGGSRNLMLGEVTPDLLTKNTPANHRKRDSLLLVLEKESFVSKDLGSSNSLCLKEPLPAELEIREDFNIKI